MKLRKKIKSNISDQLLMMVIYVSLAMVLIITLYPFLYTLILSLNDSVDAMKGGIYFWPRKFSLANYEYFFKDDRLVNAIGISLARTLLGTILGVMFTSAVAYALSFKKLMFRKVYMTMLIISMYFSGGLIPYFFILKQLHLINNFAVYIIPTLMNTFFVLIAISFFKDLPYALYESAKIDGASDLKIFLRIMLPISKPLLATIALFVAVGQWNSWIDVVFFVQNKDLKTLSYIMIELINASQTSANLTAQGAMEQITDIPPVTLQITAMVIAVFPIAVIYPLLQKYFVKGVTLGSVKG